jgi:hypothetical protein
MFSLVREEASTWKEALNQEEDHTKRGRKQSG